MKLFIKNLLKMIITIVALYSIGILLDTYLFKDGYAVSSSTLGTYAFIMYFMNKKERE